MANDYSSNPIKIDTILASSPTLAESDLNFPWYVTKIYWYNPTSIGDLAVVQNLGGKLRWQGRAEAVNGSQVHNFDPPLQFKGILVPTLGSGTLFLYVTKTTS